MLTWIQESKLIGIYLEKGIFLKKILIALQQCNVYLVEIIRTGKVSLCPIAKRKTSGGEMGRGAKTINRKPTITDLYVELSGSFVQIQSMNGWG